MSIKRGSNTIIVHCTTEVINIIKSHCAIEDLSEWNWLIKHFLQSPDVKAEFTKRYGEKQYNKTLKHYSKTNIQQRAENEMKQKLAELKDKQTRDFQKMIKQKIKDAERRKAVYLQDKVIESNGQKIYAIPKEVIEKVTAKFDSEIEVLKSQLKT